MKRKLCFLLFIVVLATSIPSTIFAQDYDKQLEKAIIKSKELFEIGDEYDKFDYNISKYDDETIFYLSWRDSEEELGSIYVTINSEGEVIRYEKNSKNSYENRPKLPNITLEEGYNTAVKFIEKVSPEVKDHLQYVENNEPLNVYYKNYSYEFRRIENGVPFYANRVVVYVDNYTGEVVDYYIYWDKDLVFDDTKGIISIDEAKEKYAEKIGLDLIYRVKYGEESKEYYLVYAPMNSSLSIDAKTGEVVTDIYIYNSIENMSKEMAAGGDIGLSPEEQMAIDEIKGIISEDEAEKIGREILDLDEDYIMDSIRLYKEWGDEGNYYWSLYFMKESEDVYLRAGIRINAITKEVTYYYKRIPTPDGAKAKYDKEESLKIAMDFIEKMAPDKKDYVELMESPLPIRPLENQEYYYFELMRKYDNAYVYNNGIYIAVDAINGKVTEYHINWSNEELPSQDNIISIDKAYDTLFNEIGLELRYIRSNEGDEEENTAILAYVLKEDKPAIIDANTGVILNSSGEPYTEKTIVSYKDIDSSYAKEKIEILAKFGIALPGDKFNPKEEMLQKDFLYLLCKAKRPYINTDDEENMYKYLVYEGIIKEEEKAPNRVITKEEAIKYIVRALGYEKIAQLDNIYKDIFKDSNDISEGLKGYVALAYGLNIVEGSNGYLNPNKAIKREDGANMIYNFLFNVK